MGRRRSTNSIDREAVVNHYRHAEDTMAATARYFGISRSTVEQILADDAPGLVRRRVPGSASPSPARGTPSLPHFRCLDQAAADAADVCAGELVSAVGVELHDAITARAQRQKDEWRHAEARARADRKARRAAKLAARAPPEPPAEPPPAELYVPVEAAAPVYSQEPPVVSPRIRTTRASGQRIPKGATLVPLTVDNPYHSPEPAHVVAPPPGSTANGHGPKEWQAPARGTLHVVTATRGDVLNYMHARGQIPRASFLAGRSYQTLYEAAAPLRMRSVDVSMPPISGASTGYEATIDGQAHAAARLEQVHARLYADVGAMGVDLVMDILAFGMTIEACAIARGDGADKQAVRFWGSFFRRCLRHLAAVLGLANRVPR